MGICIKKDRFWDIPLAPTVLVRSDSSRLPSMTYIPQKGEDEVEYAHLLTGEITMKIIAAIILGLALGWTTTALASPIQQNTNQDRIAALEARLQALEYLRWTENHAIDAVGYKVWERVSSCDLDYWGVDCYLSDPVLMPFLNLRFNGKYDGRYSRWLARQAYHYGTWSATDNGDGDSWTVSATFTVNNNNGTSTTYGPISWTVWESNGFIQAAQ